MDCQKCGLKSTQVQRCGDCGRVECGDCRTDGLCSMCVMNLQIVQLPAVQSMIKRVLDKAFHGAKSPIASDHIVSAQSSSGTPVTSINGASNDQTRSGIETSATSSESRLISDQCWSAGCSYPKSRRRGKRRRRRQRKNELAIGPDDRQNLFPAPVVPRYVWHSDPEGDFIVEQRHRYQSKRSYESKVPVRNS